MGEIADLMINGDICEFCGCELGAGDGYPRRCAECEKDKHTLPCTDKVKCKVCGKRVKKTGEKDHMRDAHGESKS